MRRTPHRIPPDPDDPDDDPPPVGYFRNFGVSANSEGEAWNMVTPETADGEITWSQSAISVDVVGRLALAIVANAGDWTFEGGSRLLVARRFCDNSRTNRPSAANGPTRPRFMSPLRRRGDCYGRRIAAS